jgi:putative transcriptional regulator
MRRKLFDELLDSVKQAKAIERGELKPGRVFRVESKNAVARTRGKLGLSQPKFAAVLGISQDTLQNWEQGRRKPSGPAKVLLKIAEKHPEIHFGGGLSQTARWAAKQKQVNMCEGVRKMSARDTVTFERVRPSQGRLRVR